MKFAILIAAVTLAVWPALAQAKVVTETVAYTHDGVVLEGYLAYDDATVGKRPGVLVVHQWMGLTDNERMRAKMLAELGYVAFAADVYGKRPGVLVVHQWMGLTDNERLRAQMLAELGYVAFAADVYGKGVRPANTGEAQQQAGKYYGDRALYRARLAAGLAQLKANGRVDPVRCAAIGYCFGGGGVLELARAGADLAGVVSFHGSLDTPLPAGPHSIKAKILVCHGAVDPYVKPEAVHGFLEEMEAAKADYQVIMYSGAVHAFTQKAAGDDPSKGAAYNADADRRSWQHMRDFFAEIFE